MKAILLAAGKGTRMLPLTLHTPKPLLEYKGMPLILHHIKALKSAGICDIIINVFHLADKIISYLGNGSKFGVKITYSDEREIGLLETGGGVFKALPMLSDPFILVSSDIYTDFNFKLLNSCESLAKIMLTDNPECNKNGDFGLKDGFLVNDSTFKLNYGNIAIIKHELFADCELKPFGLGKLFKEKAELRQIEGFYFTGLWDNIGTISQLEKVY